MTTLVYLPGDDDSFYIFASKGGASVNPDWYGNLLAAGTATLEVGTSTYSATVTELSGGERDRGYTEQPSACPASPSTRRRPRASARSRC